MDKTPCILEECNAGSMNNSIYCKYCYGFWEY